MNRVPTAYAPALVGRGGFRNPPYEKCRSREGAARCAPTNTRYILSQGGHAGPPLRLSSVYLNLCASVLRFFFYSSAGSTVNVLPALRP